MACTERVSLKGGGTEKLVRRLRALYTRVGVRRSQTRASRACILYTRMSVSADASDSAASTPSPTSAPRMEIAGNGLAPGPNGTSGTAITSSDDAHSESNSPEPGAHAIASHSGAEAGQPDEQQAVSKTRKMWTPVEDQLLRDVVEKNGAHRWMAVAEHVPGRHGKQCKRRCARRMPPDPLAPFDVLAHHATQVARSPGEEEVRHVR